MRFYKLNIDIYDDLERGYYLRRELPFDNIILLRMIENKDIDIVDEDVKCILQTDNGFKREMTFRDFREVIQIPVFEGVDFAETERTNKPNKRFSVNKNTFLFDKKTKGKNEFFYRQH